MRWAFVGVVALVACASSASAGAEAALVVEAPVTVRTAPPAAPIAFPFTVTNVGEVPTRVTFPLSPLEMDAAWGPISPMPLTLPAGEAREVAFRVHTPASFGYVSEARAFVVHVEAAPEAGGELEQTSVSFLAVAEGFYVAAPGWAAALALAAAAFLRRGR